ncbi:MAG: transposase [Thermodesulfobacteriota bacterium]
MNYDAYPDLSKLSKEIYKTAIPPFRSMITKKKRYIQEELSSFVPVEKKKYTQDWKIYYQACRTEKLMFFRIIKDAVDYLIIEKNYINNGRPPAFFSDIVKSICIKSYHNLSTWRLESELRLAKSMGVIDHVYKKSCISNYMKSKDVAEVLHELYKIIAEPLVPIETQYAADATGIANAYKAKKWVDVRLDKQEHKQYNKLHILSGTITNVIISAKITEGMKHESPIFKDLMIGIKRFKVKEISADAGYLSRKNCELIQDIGAVPYILPKKNVRTLSKGSASWHRMIIMWKKHQMLFATHYHRRSNVESTFGMIKRKWGDFCRCKLPVTQENEILARIICHNAAVLSEAMLGNDLEPVFLSS